MLKQVIDKKEKIYKHIISNEELEFQYNEKEEQALKLESANNNLIKIEKALIDSEISYHRIFESTKDGVLILDAESGMVIDVNPNLIKLLNYPREQFFENAIWEIVFFQNIIANPDMFIKLQQNEYVQYDNLLVKTDDGRVINVEFLSTVYFEDNHKLIQCNIRDITERKQMEQRQNLFSNILRILNEPNTFYETISNIIKTIKFEMNYDAIGIRIKNGNDFPYFAQVGFTEEFLFTENSLLVKNADIICNDKNDKTCLECACGMVISENTESVF